MQGNSDEMVKWMSNNKKKNQIKVNVFKRRYREGEMIEKRDEKIYITKESNLVCRTGRPYLVTVHVKSTQNTVHYVDNSLKV